MPMRDLHPCGWRASKRCGQRGTARLAKLEDPSVYFREARDGLDFVFDGIPSKASHGGLSPIIVFAVRRVSSCHDDKRGMCDMENTPEAG